MRVYIAGAMTGKFYYKEPFMKAERELKELGHIVVNPAYLPEGLADYFEINKAMIDQCDCIYVLEGWENSVGTKKELEYVKSKGWSEEAGNIIFEKDETKDSTWGWVNPSYNPYGYSRFGLSGYGSYPWRSW